MKSERLSEIIADPGCINGADIPFLEGLIKKYPYFQVAHFLLLLSLKNENSEKFNQQLRTSAMYIPDRHKLFNMLYGEQEFINQVVSREDVKESIIIEEPIEFQFENTKPELTIDVPVENESSEKQEIVPELLEIDENNIGSVEFSHSIIPDAPEYTEIPENSEGKSFSLIDKFIDENPFFTPNKLTLDEPRDDISLPSVEEDNSLVTETLASIFEIQKLYDKAIGIYEKLILKFPEKSAYFASRICELKEKIK